MGIKKTKNTPKITVITPTYNRDDFLKEIIDSVLKQDYKDFEYLILDDGSIDNTAEIVKPYLKDKRVKYFYHENAGEAETVNWGWGMAKGEYFTQVNSDDPILPGLFSEMVKVLDKKKKVVVAYPDFHFINKIGKIIKSDKNTDWNFLRALSDFSCYAASAGSFIRKSAFSDWKIIRDRRFKYINDVYMYWNMALRGKFFHVSKFLATWRVHDGGISSERYKSISEIEIWFKEYFNQNNLPKNVLACKAKTQETMYKYFIVLLELSDCGDKIKTINYYKKKLGLDYFYFKNLQVGDNDLIGNKFNGHDLHKYLREYHIESSHLVWKKESDDKNTFEIAYDLNNKEGVRNSIIELQKRYCVNSLMNPFVYDILYNKLFLDTDVVHFHLINNYIFDIQLLPIISRLKPVIWTLHDPWALGGHCIHSYDCEKWKTGCGDCSYLDLHFSLEKDNSALNFEIKKQAIQASKFDVIVSSKWMENKVKESPVLKGKKIHVIPFGINQNIFKSRSKLLVRKILKIPKNAFVITFRCDYSGFKGMDYIEYVLKNIKTKKKIYILILASNFDNKINNFVYLNFGWVKDDKLLADIYSASDLFLAPSRADSFGMMAAEAMSCGVLPIVLEGTALPDTVNAPSCGVAVRRSKKEYLKIVQYYINHNKERNLRVRKCLEYAKKQYDKDVYVKKILKVYKNSIKNFKINKNDKYLLNQLKKYMIVQPGTSSNYFYQPLYIKIIKKIIPQKIQGKIKDIFLITFYKVDKIFPKGFRLYEKLKLMKYYFVRKYIIK